MKPPEITPAIELNVDGPQAAVYLTASAISKAGGDEEYLDAFFDECQKIKWHPREAILDIARKFVEVTFNDEIMEGPDHKPQIQITSEDDMNSVRQKTTAALEKAGAGNSYGVKFLFETAFCKSREEMENVCGSYVTIKAKG